MDDDPEGDFRRAPPPQVHSDSSTCDARPGPTPEASPGAARPGFSSGHPQIGQGTKVNETSARLGPQQRAIFLGLLAAVTCSAMYYYAHQRGREFTDDAQLDADIAAVPARVSALVRRIAFVDNQRVRGGDLLVELDDDIARTKVAQAEATLAAETSAAAAAEADAVVAVRLAKSNRGMSEAQLASARVSVDAARDQIREAEVAREAAHAEERRTAADLLRTQKLANTGTASVAELEHVEADHRQAAFALEQADLRISNVRNAVIHAATRETEATAKLYGTHVEALVDQASRRAQAARARVGVADAALLLARLELDYTKIRSPADGIVSKRSVTVGQMVDVGQPVVQLIATQRLWVTANFKETQLKEMRAGQGVRLKFDVEPSTEYSGVVENFSGATGARFALLPPDNATGNFTKVVQRVPVRIRLGDVALPLNLIPGVSVEATVLTR